MYMISPPQPISFLYVLYYFYSMSEDEKTYYIVLYIFFFSFLLFCKLFVYLCKILMKNYLRMGDIETKRENKIECIKITNVPK